MVYLQPNTLQIIESNEITLENLSMEEIATNEKKEEI